MALAPGQMTKDEIMYARLTSGTTSFMKNFYLIGKDISNSPSPIMHNTAFKSNAVKLVI